MREIQGKYVPARFSQKKPCKENGPKRFPREGAGNLQVIEDPTFVPSTYDFRGTRLGSGREPRDFVAFLCALPLQSVNRAPRRDAERELEPPPHKEPAILQGYPFLWEAHLRWTQRQ